MNFHEKIRLLRSELELTQEEVSKKTGLAISSIRNYEKDKLPESKQLVKLKEFYKVPYEYLLDDSCNTRENLIDYIKILETKLAKSEKLNELYKESIINIKKLYYNNLRMSAQLLEIDKEVNNENN